MIQQLIELIKSWFKKLGPDRFADFEWPLEWQFAWWELMAFLAILIILGLVLYWIWK